MRKIIKRAIAFGNYLSKIRTRRGYSLRQLSYITDVNYSYINSLENHHRLTIPKISTINKLAKGLRVSPNEMYKIAGVKGVRTNDFGKILRSIRHKRKLGVNQLAYKAHVDPATISKFEKGQRTKPKVQTVVKLARALKVPASKLLGATDYPTLTVLPSTVDLDKLVSGDTKITWDGRPLNSTDVLALKLWFKHKS